MTTQPHLLLLPRQWIGGTLTGTDARQAKPVQVAIPSGASTSVVPTLDDLLTADPDQFVAKYTDIAAVNLACARGLPNCDESEFPKYLALLDAMADAVRRQTERSWRLFKLKPAEFHDSENVFRVFTMEHVLRVQFGVKYDPVVGDATKTGMPRELWDSTEVFIHGVLSEKRTGTCSSLPTFSIAVGRRLGYALKLVRVPNHTLFRWDDGREKFNHQHTEAGGDILPDEHFYTWPRKWDEFDYQLNTRTKVWLHSMAPKQEVSKFLCNRAILLAAIRRYDEALLAIDAAARFDPTNPACAEIHIGILDEAGRSAFAPLMPPPAPLLSGTSVRTLIEPGRDDLLDAANLFRDRTKDPKHLCVRITRLLDARVLTPQPTITIPTGTKAKER